MQEDGKNNNKDEAREASLFDSVASQVASVGFSAAIEAGKQMVEDGVFDDDPDGLQKFEVLLVLMETTRYNLDQQVV